MESPSGAPMRGVGGGGGEGVALTCRFAAGAGGAPRGRGSAKRCCFRLAEAHASSSDRLVPFSSHGVTCGCGAGPGSRP